MCLDILEREEIITYREKERPMLMDIRNGKYMLEDGTYSDEFFDMVSNFERRLQYAKKHTSLPARPDFKSIQEVVMDGNRSSLGELWN